MTETLQASRAFTPARAEAGWIERLCRRVLLDKLTRLSDGEIVLVEHGRPVPFGVAGDAGLHATVTVEDPRFWSAVVLRGSAGAGEAFMEGWWRCEDVATLSRILVRNDAVLGALERGFARVGAPALRFAHALRPNTRRGSRRNIHAHYDLGNEFFRLFLDETLTYSSGTFPREDATLAEASQVKYDRICRKLALSPGLHVLEIGTGWGGFALHAAGRYGCRVTTTTISEAQYTLARERVAAAGLGDRIEVLRRDYRDLDGRYDRLVSIEMIEAVGPAHLETYFRRCSELLASDGRMALQMITTADHRYEAALRRVDFIQRYIFPGGFIPSITAVCAAASRASDLRIFHLDDQAPHYARTLRLWRERFDAREDEVRALGFDDRFVRMWRYYLATCEGGFEERFLGSVQAVLVKPGARPAPILAGIEADAPGFAAAARA
jgi:cyclopropane-fatty-acyl-phospholipid synthase